MWYLQFVILQIYIFYNASIFSCERVHHVYVLFLRTSGFFSTKTNIT